MAGTFTKNIKNKFIEEFITDVANTSSNYYVAFGRDYPWDDDNAPPAGNTSLKTSYYDIHKDMLFGKKINETDFSYVFRVIPWASGIVYDYYSHLDSDLFDKDFYVINQYGRVYKCLFNNYGAQSTVEPNDTNTNGDFVTQPDNYRWKYMFRVTNALKQKFQTNEYFPYANTSDTEAVRSSSEPGAIHVIVVDNDGIGYVSGSGYIDETINSTTIRLANSGASSINGAYSLSTMYINSGTGTGTFRNITDYVVNATGKYVVTDTLLPSLDTTSSYIIGPKVTVVGDGGDVQAVAYVNSTSGAIDSIDVINRGINYTYANVYITANSNFGSGATATAIVSPPGGHGSDPISELGCETVAISTDITIRDDIPKWATFRQVSLLYNPIAANGIPYSSDTFKQYTTLRMASNPGTIPQYYNVYGSQSGANGIVAYQDSTNLYVTSVKGSFSTFETITNNDTSLSFITTQINNEDLQKYTGEIFYYNNVEPITRSVTSSERVQLYFKF